MKKIAMGLWLGMISTPIFSGNLSIQGTVSQEIHLPMIQSLKSGLSTPSVRQPSSKRIQLLKVKLSAREKKALSEKAQRLLTATAPQSMKKNTRSAVALGMGDVPVLDQGMHGTCVTFAVTAAIDAALGKGDYISQLCQLQLGNYLERNGYTPSGWEGAWGSEVLTQMETFGIINKSNEALGCGGLMQYPIDGEEPDSYMDVEDFHSRSEPLFDFDSSEESAVHWEPILNIYHAIDDRVNTNQTLADVKTSLQAGDRVVFAVLFPAADLGVAGAVGKYRVENDSWILTPEVARDLLSHSLPFLPAHEMVITGYDDQAEARDEHGQVHRGLLTLRNSWGEQAGNHGTFYMSYDYFKLLVIEAQRIRRVADDALE